ncbi:uncharacterized protein LOC117646928 [Thrips palmi]|uniref:Uncharacterized protein LOC117646928 n=1 Tax=Thrips palmi TaxID=161013 RepID=A0A6P8Z3C1_THRPL|nr:uncharacterized protein LOC117646928 [Thrips palmi]
MYSFTPLVLLVLTLAVMLFCLVPPSLASSVVLPGHAIEPTIDQRGETLLAPEPSFEAGRSIRVARGLGKRLKKIGKKIDHGVRHVKVGEIGFGMPKGKNN